MRSAATPIKRLQDFNELADYCEQFVKDLAAGFAEWKDKANQATGHVESCKTCTSAGCCYQVVTITIMEAIPIARKIRRDGKSTVEFRRLLQMTGEEMEGQTTKDWFELARPCVFLTPDKRCSIYEIRPAPCSTHSVVNSPPEYCSPPNRRLPVLLVNNHQFSDIMLRANAEFQKELGLPELPPLMGVFPKMVSVVLEAMTQPWDQFVKNVWENGRLSQEVLDRQTDADSLDLLRKQLEAEGIHVQSNISRKSPIGAGQPRAGREGND